MKKFLGLFAILALTLGIMVGQWSHMKTVKADSGDSLATFFGSAASTGTVITGSSTQRIILKDVVLTSTTSVTLVIQEHPASGSNVTLAQVGLIANTPYRLDGSFWQTSGGGGFVTGIGSTIVVVSENGSASTATLSTRYALN